MIVILYMLYIYVSVHISVQAMAWMLESAISMYLEGNGSFIDTASTNANSSSSSNGNRAAYAHRQQQQYGDGYVLIRQLALLSCVQHNSVLLYAAITYVIVVCTLQIQSVCAHLHM
jgi:hypothetical protein